MVFSYRPLSQERSEIRLVRFVDSDENPTRSPIRLEICHVSLDDGVDEFQYGALSYAWGDPHKLKTAQIYIGGELFVIGDNLHAGLMQLRENGVRSWLWIDSICIQQSDTEEKTWQVAQMRAIFGQAALVYIWLGPGCGETDRVMDFVHRIAPRVQASGAADIDMQKRDRIKMDLATQLCKQNNTDDDGEVALMEPELATLMIGLFEEPGLRPETGETSLVDGIHIILQREYWHRIWIIQEVTLAKDAVVLCGAKSVASDIFHAVFRALKWASVLSQRTRDYRDFEKGLSTNFYENTALHTRRQYLYGDEPITLRSIVVPNGRPSQRPFYSASDPRDIVFGVLGIVTEEGALGLSVDYKKTPTQVFTALTRALIKRGDDESLVGNTIPNFHLGNIVPMGEGNTCDLPLPTWVPDWREVGKRGFLDTRSVYGNATRDTSPPSPDTSCTEEDDRLGRLRRPGCRVDVITEVMEPPRWELESEWGLPMRLAKPQDFLASILEFANLGPESSPGEDHVWRTVMMEHFTVFLEGYFSFHAREEILSLVRKMARRERIDAKLLTPEQKRYVKDYAETWNLYAETFEKLLERVATYLDDSIRLYSRGRTLFKTSKGMFGLCHVAVRPGDVVILLWGTMSPIILRRRGQSNGAGGGFSWMGDAYVDGIMDGEFLKTSPAHETFDIY